MIIEVGICVDLRDAIAISVYMPGRVSDKVALVRIEMTSGQTLIGHIDDLDYEGLAAFVLSDRSWVWDFKPSADQLGWLANKDGELE